MTKAEKKISKATYYQENKAKIAEQGAKHYHDNKKAILKQNAEYRKQNEEKIAKQRAIYRRKNKKQLTEKDAKYYKKNKKNIRAKNDAYLEKNKGLIAKQRAKYRKNNKKKIAQAAAVYAKINREKIAARTVLWRVANKRKIAEDSAKRRHSPVLFDTYALKLSWAEEVRESPANRKELQVKCALCKTWFAPSQNEVSQRMKVLNGKGKGDCNFYCSDNCKKLCPVFGKIKYREGEMPGIRRYGQTEWKQYVMVCAEYRCERCGKIIEKGIAHHIRPVSQYPLESMDIDNGLYLCKDCDKTIHSEKGCRPVDLRCNA